MPRFNQSTKGNKKTTTHEGAEAYKLTPEMELYTLTCTSTLHGKFYESAAEQAQRMRNLLDEVDPQFAWNLAIYARDEMWLRTVPVFLAVELTRRGHGSREGVRRVIQRPDEITEMLAYYEHVNGGVTPLANSIKRGIADAFNKFDSYQLAKYQRNDQQVTLRDALFITHPEPEDSEQEEAFDDLANENLDAPYTWEVELSRLGQQDFETEQEREDAVREKWRELILSDRLGYFALVRNLRNMLEADVGVSALRHACDTISDPDRVLSSRMFPFQYLSAADAVREVGSTHSQFVLDALEDAIRVAAQNIPSFDENDDVLIAGDVSGSMSGSTISPRSSVQYKDVALIMSMLLNESCDFVTTSVFATDFKIVNVPSTNIIQSARQLSTPRVGHGTNGHLVLEWANQNDKSFDRVAIFTDLQMFKNVRSQWQTFKQNNPDAKLYIFDLGGYGNAMLDIDAEQDVYQAAGWSPKIFDAIESFEEGESVIDELSSGSLVGV